MNPATTTTWDTLDEWISAANAAGAEMREVQGKWRGRCPVHEGTSKDSLSICQGRDAVLVKCFAGCRFVDLRATLFGAHPAHQVNGSNGRTSKPKQPKAARVTNRKDYRFPLLVRGRYVPLIHRREDLEGGGKRIRWLHEDADGGEVWGLPPGVSSKDVPLYRWPEAAEREDAIVVLVEGEKAADALWSRGIVAVGTACGADATPSAEALNVLRGREVSVWPDNDDPGRKHASNVLGALEGIAAGRRVIRWAEAPEKGDAADWTGTTEDLQDLLDAAEEVGAASPAPEYVISGEWQAKPWAIQGVLRQGRLGLIFGPPKSSKSNLTLALATNVVMGRDPIRGVWIRGRDWECESALVLSEMTEDDSNEMMRVLYDPPGVTSGKVRFLSQSMADSLKDVDGLIAELRRRYAAKPFGLLLLDTLTHWFVMLDKGEDMNGLRVKVLLQRLKALGHELGIVVLIVAHTRKDVGVEVSFDDILGTGGGIRGATDANISLQLIDPGSTLMRMKMEARDPHHMRRIAQAATRRARGLEPEYVTGTPRSWYLRLDWYSDRLQYVKAEQELVDGYVDSLRKIPKADRPEVTQAILDALETLHAHEFESPRGSSNKEPIPVHVFSVDTVTDEVQRAWTGEGKHPGTPTVRKALAALVADDRAFHIDPRAHKDTKPPGYGRFGGYGLGRFMPGETP